MGHLNSSIKVLHARSECVTVPCLSQLFASSKTRRYFFLFNLILTSSLYCPNLGRRQRNIERFIPEKEDKPRSRIITELKSQNGYI